MIHVIHWCTLLGLTAKLANAGSLENQRTISVTPNLMTLSDQTKLTCCAQGQVVSQCNFYADLRYIGNGTQSNSTDIHPCCELTVSGKHLLGNVEQILTTVNICCKSKGNYSQNATSTVIGIYLSGDMLLSLVVLSTWILVLSLITIITWIVLVIRKQRRKRKFCPATAQKDTDTLGANPGTVEESEEKKEVVQDDVLYATVNHSAFDESSAPRVTFQSGTDYATVVMN